MKNIFIAVLCSISFSVFGQVEKNRIIYIPEIENYSDIEIILEHQNIIKPDISGFFNISDRIFASRDTISFQISEQNYTPRTFANPLIITKKPNTHHFVEANTYRKLTNWLINKFALKTEIFYTEEIAKFRMLQKANSTDNQLFATYTDSLLHCKLKADLFFLLKNYLHEEMICFLMNNKNTEFSKDIDNQNFIAFFNSDEKLRDLVRIYFEIVTQHNSESINFGVKISSDRVPVFVKSICYIFENEIDSAQIQLAANTQPAELIELTINSYITGKLHAAKGNRPAAKTSFENTISLLNNFNSSPITKLLIAPLNISLAELYLAWEMPAVAISFFQKAIENEYFSTNIESPYIADLYFNTLMEGAEIYNKNENYDNANQLYIKGIEAFKKNNAENLLLADCYKKSGLCNSLIGNFEQAYLQYDSSKILYIKYIDSDKFSNYIETANIITIQANLKAQMFEFDNAKSLYQQAIEIYEQIENQYVYSANADKAFVYFNWGNLFYTEEKAEQAIEKYELALHFYNLLTEKDAWTHDLHKTGAMINYSTLCARLLLENADAQYATKGKQLAGEAIAILGAYDFNPTAQDYFSQAQNLFSFFSELNMEILPFYIEARNAKNDADNSKSPTEARNLYKTAIEKYSRLIEKERTIEHLFAIAYLYNQLAFNTEKLKKKIEYQELALQNIAEVYSSYPSEQVTDSYFDMIYDYCFQQMRNKNLTIADKQIENLGILKSDSHKYLFMKQLNSFLKDNSNDNLKILQSFLETEIISETDKSDFFEKLNVLKKQEKQLMQLIDN